MVKHSKTKPEVSGEEISIEESAQSQVGVLEITHPAAISEFLHDKKTQLLEILIESEKTIRELSEEMDLNPGSVKRYLDSLLKNDLVFQTKITQNQWGIRLKYYLASAKKYTIKMTFPEET